jgi:hypothetical protein
MRNIIKKLLKEGLNGEGLSDTIWYHGTKNDFREFDLNYFGETDAGWWGYGVYFHTDKNRGGYGDIVKAVRLNFKNPIILPLSNSGNYLYNIISDKSGLPLGFKDESAMNIIRKIGNKKFTNILLELGYDGMIIQYSQGTKEAVAFDTSIIKIINQNINKKRQ